MNVSGDTEYYMFNSINGTVNINQDLGQKTQNIDLATTNNGNTNCIGVLEVNGIPISGGSIPQPYPGTFEAGYFSANAMNIKNGTSSTLITSTSGLLNLPLILPTIQATAGQVLTGSATGQTSWANNSVTGYLPLTGGTLSGALTSNISLLSPNIDTSTAERLNVGVYNASEVFIGGASGTVPTRILGVLTSASDILSNRLDTQFSSAGVHKCKRNTTRSNHWLPYANNGESDIG